MQEVQIGHSNSYGQRILPIAVITVVEIEMTSAHRALLDSGAQASLTATFTSPGQ